MRGPSVRDRGNRWIFQSQPLDAERRAGVVEQIGAIPWYLGNQLIQLGCLITCTMDGIDLTFYTICYQLMVL